MNSTSKALLLLLLYSNVSAHSPSHKRYITRHGETRPTPYERSVIGWLAEVNDEMYVDIAEMALLRWTADINGSKAATEKTSNYEENNAKKSMARNDKARKYIKILEEANVAERMAENYPGEFVQLISLANMILDRNSSRRREREELATELREIEISKVCLQNGTCLRKPEFEASFAQLRDVAELRSWWNSYQETSTPELAASFLEVARIDNEVAWENDFGDAGRMEMFNDFGMVDYLAEAERLVEDLSEMHQLLHAFVRQRIGAFYGKENLPEDGTIPVYLSGTLYGQMFNELASSILKPYPEVATDFTPKLHGKYPSVKYMAKEAEKFYTSIGFEKMPPSFWNVSIFSQPTGNRSIPCHPKAIDMNRRPKEPSDVRVVICGEVNEHFFEVIHHEMGHCQYYLHYKQQPSLFRAGANAGFHEAIGDTITLSTFSLAHAKKLQLVSKRQLDTDYHKKLINRGMATMLRTIPLAVSAFTLTAWRSDVYSGKISHDKLNTAFWEYRRQYEGVSAGERRAPHLFDAGAKSHIAEFVPYLRYFFAALAQFQFHESLCIKAGHTGLLMECDISGSKEAGDAFSAAMRLGSSRPWPEVMEMLTGRSTLSTNAIHKYYQPVVKWLKTQVKPRSIGWKNTD